MLAFFFSCYDSIKQEFIVESRASQLVSGHEPTRQCERGRSPGLGRPLEKGMAITPVFSPGESRGQRGLAGSRGGGHD